MLLFKRADGVNFAMRCDVFRPRPHYLIIAPKQLDYLREHFGPSFIDQHHIISSDSIHPDESSERNFRWAYQLLVALAKKLIDEANTSLLESQRRYWDDMLDSTRAAWLTKARDLAGIDHEEFLAPIRSGQYHVADIYDEAGANADS